MLPAMIEGGGGAVINMVSRQGVAPPQSAQRVSYGVSKAAIIMLTRHMAVAYGKKGIRCNAVAPGTIRTERMLATLSQERIAQSRHNVLTPDLGEPADISNMVAFLASDSGRYITGQTIQIDGGVLSYLHE
jgi:NAD(P)-dependent dehydrogenase (short-subunit alcohol dehydrogenase family)